MGDIVNTINGWCYDIVAGVIGTLWSIVYEFITMLQALVITTILTPFDELLGATGVGDDGEKAIQLLEKVGSTTITSFAFTVLAIVLLVQMIKIGQRLDANQTLPAVREMIMLVCFAAIIIALVNSWQDIMKGIYDLCQQLALAFSQYSQLDGLKNIVDPHQTIEASLLGERTDSNVLELLPSAFVLAIGLLVMLIGVIVCMVICFVMALARGLQIGIMYIFAPVMLACLGLDETRQWSLNYLRNFGAVCLSGAIMVAVMVFYPLLINGALNQGLANVSQIAAALYYLIEIAGVTVVCTMGVMKSGAWASSILGG